MTFYSQEDSRWSGIKINDTKYTIRTDGCFVCALSMLDGRSPDQVEEVLSSQGGFDGPYVKSEDSARILGLEYNGISKSKPNYPTIAETSYYGGQHFFVIFPDGTCNDPLLDHGNTVNFYPIKSYRLFKPKAETPQEDFMTDQKLHDLVRNIVYTGYVLELGREPESDQIIEDHASWIMRDSGDSYNFKGAMEWLVNLHNCDEAQAYRQKQTNDAVNKAVEQIQVDYQKEKDRMAKQLADSISACKKEADDRTVGDVRQDNLLSRIIGYISDSISRRTK